MNNYLERLNVSLKQDTVDYMSSSPNVVVNVRQQNGRKCTKQVGRGNK